MTDATELDTAAIRARLEAATPGPWHIGPDSAGQAMAVRGPARDHVASCRYDDDLEFIAHARTDVERLLAALGDARSQVARERADVEEKWAEAQGWITRAEAAESALAAVRDLADDLRDEFFTALVPHTSDHAWADEVAEVLADTFTARLRAALAPTDTPTEETD